MKTAISALLLRKERIKVKEKNLKGKILIIALVAVLVAIISVLGIVIYNLANKPDEPVSQDRRISEGLAVGNEESNSKASDARFTTDMNMVWTFPSGSPISNNAIIGNSPSNLYECYFEVYLNDEEQTLLYSSPVLPVGTRLDQLELDQALPDGDYDAICTFHLLDDEDPEKELSTVSFAVSLMFLPQS